MATEVRLPELGENIESGNVVKVLVSVGQKIDKDQPLMELETDKATIEVPSSVGGVIKEIHVKEGAKAEVGQVVVTVDSGEDAKEKPAPKVAEQKAAPVAEQQEQGKVKPAPKEVRESAVEEKREPSGAADAESESEPEPSQKEKPAPASPSVRRLARETGVNIDSVVGTGPGGRITAEDVKQHSRQLLQAGSKPSARTRDLTALPDFAKWGQIERKPMSGIRQKTAEHLALAWANVPQVTQFDKADITDLEKYRKRFGEKVEASGGKLTVTSILIKIASGALRAFPQFNAAVDMANHEIIFKNYIHIGVATDTDRGLLVPVIRDVDRKNILQLARELTELSEKARNKKLTLEEMQGGSFTVTNLGGIGGTYFSPIVNFPEVAILGVSRGNIEPVYRNGQFEPRTILPLSLSYDHRVIDGADAARFLRWICEALQDPFLLALEG